MRWALLVMAKRPQPGRTKTRLSPPLTHVQAAVLYECFLLDVIGLVRSLPGVTPYIAFSPPDQESYFAQLAPDFRLVPQRGSSLGERLDDVLSSVLRNGFGRVAAISSDSPTLPTSHLAQAFDLLADETVDVVLGPAEDGGYYLIGVKEPQPRLVREVQMSTSTVLRETLSLAASEGLRVALLPPWFDVDGAGDLYRLKRDLAVAPAGVAPRTREYLCRVA